eukprot:m.1337303 g.1337303  ORF g.1337303 m.1337303 type:complete len:99 (+) comp24882_c1_seq11:2323-2619(+)
MVTHPCEMAPTSTAEDMFRPCADPPHPPRNGCEGSCYHDCAASGILYGGITRFADSTGSSSITGNVSYSCFGYDSPSIFASRSHRVPLEGQIHATDEN